MPLSDIQEVLNTLWCLFITFKEIEMPDTCEIWSMFIFLMQKNWLKFTENL